MIRGKKNFFAMSDIQFSHLEYIDKLRCHDCILLVFAQTLFQMYESSHPILRHRGMPLAGNILGKKDVSRSKGFHGSVADADCDRPGQRNAPLAARRVMPAMEIVAVEVVLENHGFRRNIRQKKLPARFLVQLLEVGLQIGAGIDSAKLHGPSSE
jgi:hypothetical protein